MFTPTFGESKQFNNVVVVKAPSDLANIDSDKTYLIDGTIDMGSMSIEIPEGGLVAIQERPS